MAREIQSGNDYFDRLLKLIPGEFVALYLAVTGLVKDNEDYRQPVLLVVVALFIVLIPLFLVFIRHVTNFIQIGITTFSFLLWAYSLGHAFDRGEWLAISLHDTTISSVAIFLWTGIVPLFVKQPSTE